MGHHSQHCFRSQDPAFEEPEEYTISSLANDLDHQTSAAGADIEIYKEDLLPGTKR
jgi:hypothetical protein